MSWNNLHSEDFKIMQVHIKISNLHWDKEDTCKNSKSLKNVCHENKNMT